MTEPIIPIERYQMLATEIVKVACIDYVDASIVKIAKEAEIKRWRDKVLKIIIEYGRGRYITMRGTQIVQQSEFRNCRYMKMLRKRLDDKNIKKAMDTLRDMNVEIRSDLAFFHSPEFDIYAPNTDAEALIDKLNEKVRKGERVDGSVRPFFRTAGKGKAGRPPKK